MEPRTPVTRNRRSDRNAAPEQPMQPMQSAQPAPVYPQQPAPLYQRPAQAYQQQPVQQPIQAYQQRPMQQPVQTYQQQPAQAYQQRPIQQPAARPPMVQPAQRPAANAPRALQQQRVPASGWQTPTQRPQAAQGVPRGTLPPRAGSRGNVDAAPPTADTAPRKKAVPAWLTGALAAALIVVMGLVAARYLMEAAIVTKEKARLADYQAVLDNYHVSEDVDGTRRITWQGVIERYANEYNLEPAFVAAIIRNESSFRTNAESGVGARGLMQMMPDTAEWIAGKLDDDGYTFDSMWDGETNIRYGCWYLGYLSEMFRGDPVLVCAAYHAGQGEVRSWLNDRSISPDGLTVPIENVPISETRQYAGRVTQAYGIYQSLLYTDTPQLPEYAAAGGAAAANAR